MTGRPGSGKTTLLRAVAGALAGRRLAGFVTEEIREAGIRRGFRLVTLDGRARVMAHVGIAGGARVGRYGVDVDAIDALAVDGLALRPDVDVYLVDEIGKMECLSPGFVAAMRTLLDSRHRVVATIGQRGGGFIAEAKRRDDVELWTLTTANRDAMPARVVAWLREEAA